MPPAAVEQLSAKVHSILAAWIHELLAIELKFMEMTGDYGTFSPRAVLQHAYYTLLGASVDQKLSHEDVRAGNNMWRTLAAPYEAQLAILAAQRGQAPPHVLAALDFEPLRILGVPVLAIGGSAEHTSINTANSMLERLQSDVRLRVIYVHTAPQLLMARVDFAQSEGTNVYVRQELARTAQLPFQMSSTQDVGGQGLVIFRCDCHQFLARCKWNLDTIAAKAWDPTTYGPTQKIVALLWTLDPEHQGPAATALQHLLETSHNYQHAEARFTAGALSPADRGLLHALVSHFPELDDMYALLIDTLGTQLSPSFVARMAQLPPAQALTRLLMHATDAWFGPDRAYTMGTLAMLLASVTGSGAELDTQLLAKRVIPATASLVTGLLTRLCQQVRAHLEQATYAVQEHTCKFDEFSRALEQHYATTKSWSPGSLELEACSWTTVLRFAMRTPTGLCLQALKDAALADFAAYVCTELLQVPPEPSASTADIVHTHVFPRWDAFVQSVAAAHQSTD